MAESIADRYRARFPPKEHEEAVRMLLEGVERQKIEDSINNRARRMTSTGRALPTNYQHQQQKSQHIRTIMPDSSSLEDRKSLNSSTTANETNSSSGIVDFNGLESRSDSQGINGMASKSTSTASESVSISEKSIGDEAVQTGDDDLIPSRTIAVQCDLKWSSVRNNDALFDTSMQASSISSTRYGFYDYNHETLAKRHLLRQRSSSYRDLDRMNMYDEEVAATTKGYRGKQQQQTLSNEAPTSMSELSSEASDDENIAPSHKFDARDQENHSLNQLTSKPKPKPKTDERGPSELKQVSRLSSRGRQMYGSVLDNSMSTARARIDSLPRRPVTAMSYVSPNKLRHQQQQQHRQSDTDSADSDVGEEVAARSRVRGSESYQNLVRPKTPLGNRRQLSGSSNASSDSELAAHRKPRSTLDARQSSSVHHQYSYGDAHADEEENRRSEEMILTSSSSSKSRAPIVGQQRPQLVESRHQEEIQDLDGMLDQFRRAEAELRNNSVYRPKYSTLRPSDTQASFSASKQTQAESRSRLAASSMSLPRKTTSRRSQMVMDQPADHDDDMNTAPHQRRPSEDSSARRAHPREAQRQSAAQVGRSTSMRQISSRPSVLRKHERPQRDSRGDAELYDGRHELQQQTETNTTPQLTRNRSQTLRPSSSNGRALHQHQHQHHQHQVNEDDSDALASKTWSNPAGIGSRNRVVRQQISTPPEQLASQREMAATGKGAARSMSMRDVNQTTKYAGHSAYRSNANFTAKYNDNYESSSESSDVAVNESVVRNLAARLSPLDYDSQQRLNESGLPEVNTAPESTRAASYLGPKNHYHHASQDGLQQRYLSGSHSNGRGGGGGGGQIEGRAMSQQSLTRPTMPISASGRRWQTAAGGSASSDVGGSSMSLATRLHGRYESAHTRSPIVMYIPPASSSRASSLKGEDSLLGTRAQRSTLKRGSRSPRSRSRPGSQDRSTIGRRQRSVTRNGSDSESSSILKTLARARGSRGADSGPYSSKRIARMQNIPVNNMIDTDDEDMDGVGRLATEVDSYKFIRRYSVPKDAKINWFSRLRQRVASGNR